MAAATYKHVPVDENDIELTGLKSQEESLFEDEEEDSMAKNDDDDDGNGDMFDDDSDPSLTPTDILLALFSIPILFLWIGFAYEFTGRLWSVWVFVLHLQLRIGVTHSQFKQQKQRSKLSSFFSSAATVLDLCLFGVAYPAVAVILTEVLFRDVDGTINLDWRSEVRLLRVMAVLGATLAILRLGIGCRTCCCCKNENRIRTPRTSNSRSNWSRPRNFSFWNRIRQKVLPISLYFTNTALLFWNVLCILSVLSHFGPWPSTRIFPESCDPMDPTLCALPFPSFHHMRKDDTTTTGWRVDLKGLVPLRGGIPFHPTFLNELDGFSTMAPILFYMEGLKEAHERGNVFISGLQGPEHIEASVSEQSITLLINVDEHTLVPHSAEIDYLDPQMPLVMVMPAQPLSHQTHFAVLVVNAMDAKGDRLPRTSGMESLMKDYASPRFKRYLDAVFPAIHETAPWVDFSNDPNSVQMIFDFVTMSEDSQLGNVRAVRDSALEHIEEWDWKDHVEMVSQIKYDCNDENNLIAKTVHIHLDVPSFLKSRSRYSTLDTAAIRKRTPVSIAKAKAMIQIPCSMLKATQADVDGKPIKAIMEYGHGLFYNRGEVSDGFLSRMANDNGYILTAMDWRGMSLFDLPVVIKTLIGNPNQFQSVRDNLIQGYAEKLALQHFSRNGMLDWLSSIDGINLSTEKDERPATVFYGISQGGILGGGYLALSGNTSLIDRGILGSPGTPFTSVLTRSMDFIEYDTLLLFNFYNNRQVRLLLSFIQMAWDSVEAAGLLAPPIDEHESLPPTLLQTGLGDPIVPIGACEAMTRAMHGSTLPNNPRTIYGIPVESPGNGTWEGPRVTLTELMYEEEYSSLPVDNTLPAWGNSVHWCVRWDAALIKQVEEFANTGRIIDPCVEDQCRRQNTVGC